MLNKKELKQCCYPLRKTASPKRLELKDKIMTIQTTNPFTNKVTKTFEEISEATLDQFVSQAVTAFHDWKKTSYSFRASLLQKVAQLMKERKSELALPLIFLRKFWLLYS